MSFERVQKRIYDACKRVGRDPSEVTLVAVTKNHSVNEIEDKILRFGHRILGENRVQEWRKKKEQLSDIQWHMIGNLQTNKVKYCRDFYAIHSLSNTRLADEMQRQGLKLKHSFKVFVEVNVVGESSKQGAPFEEAEDLVDYAKSLSCLEVYGLMTMAPYNEDLMLVRKTFRKLKQLCDKLALKELSMGMSNDFEVAIEEGATYIRVGSALFED